MRTRNLAWFGGLTHYVAISQIQVWKQMNVCPPERLQLMAGSIAKTRRRVDESMINSY
jgi:hypothetical protein